MAVPLLVVVRRCAYPRDAMANRLFVTRLFPVVLLAWALSPGTSRAQVAFGAGIYAGPGAYGPYTAPLYPFVGWPGFQGAFGSYWTNGLSLYGPPVPVPGPIPGVFGNGDLVNQWRARPTLGLGVGYFGWVGPLDPRYRMVYRTPIVVEPLPPVAPGQAAAGAAGCVFLSVKVPQPTAEVFIGGLKMNQIGLDRLYTTPPLAADKEAHVDVVARWVERGATVECKKVAVGKPGEVVRVDFTVP